MQNLPKISIVTPSYNQHRFIERTIVSVLNQGYPNLEYIIVDGGSTDGSVEVIKKYEKHLAFWISEQDQSQSNAIDKGFGRSTGDILAWLNSDDMLLPGALSAVAGAFEKHPEAALIYGDYIKVDSDDRCIALRRQPSFDLKICLHAYTIAMQPASFFGRKAFFETGGIDKSLHYVMDHDLVLRLAQHGEVLNIRNYVAAFRVHPESKTERAEESQTQESRRWLCPKYLQRVPLPGELPVLHWYHTARLVVRMTMEGCLASRFGRDKGDYRLTNRYTPTFNGFCGEAQLQER